MRHLYTFIFVTAVSSVLLSGCKKDTENTSPSSSCRIASVGESLTDATSYEYDSRGRLTKAIASNGYSTVYSYEGNRLMVKYYNAAGEYESSSKDEFYLNAQGYLERTITWFQFPDSSFRRTEYSYSADDYLSKTEWFDDKGKFEGMEHFVYENGNLVRMEFDGVEELKYTYLPEENKGGIRQFPFRDYPMEHFMGKPNKNLVNTVRMAGSVGTYRYQMENGLPVYCYIEETGKPAFWQKRYTFDCQ